MTAQEYLDKLISLDRMLKEKPYLYDVYADVRVKYQINKMKGIINYENNRKVRRSVLETKFKGEEFNYFPEGETIFQ